MRHPFSTDGIYSELLHQNRHRYTISRLPPDIRFRGHQEDESILNVRGCVMAERLILGSESCCQHASRSCPRRGQTNRGTGRSRKTGRPSYETPARAQTSPIAASASVSAFFPEETPSCALRLAHREERRAASTLLPEGFWGRDGRHAQQACCYWTASYSSSTLSQGDKPPSCRLPQGLEYACLPG